MRLTIALVLALLVGSGAALAANELIVTEIMYNSTESTDVEWIELFNNTAAPLDLTGWWLVGNDPVEHTHIPLSGTMAAGEVKVLAGTEALFTAKYPGVTNLFPVFFQTYGVEWSLGNGGDSVNIYDAADGLVFTMTYDDGTPGILTGTVASAGATWSKVKFLFR